jgi:hypothetical protein
MLAAFLDRLAIIFTSKVVCNPLPTTETKAWSSFCVHPYLTLSSILLEDHELGSMYHIVLGNVILDYTNGNCNMLHSLLPAFSDCY